MADQNQVSSGPLPLALLATVGVGGYIAGRFTKKDGDSPLPSLTSLALTFVVFRGLDVLWPSVFGTVQNAVQTTVPAIAGFNVGGIAQAFRQQQQLNPSLSYFPPVSRNGVKNATINAPADSYSVK